MAPEPSSVVGGRLRAVVGSVRARITIAALVVVAVTLALGGAVLVWTLHRSLTNGVAATATTEAGNVAALVAAGTVPTDLPVRSGVAVQVVDGTGRVVLASSDLRGRPAVSSVRPAVGHQQTLSTPGVLPGDDDPDLTVATTVDSPHGPRTVYAVATVEQVGDSTQDLAVALAIGLPILVVLAGVLAWVLAGRALSPVEAIRAEVADLSAGDLHRRVPEPPTDDEVGRLARTMNAMLARMESSRDRQRRFVSDASHELRSPLAALLTQVEVAQARPDDADWPHVADVVVLEGDRLRRIIDDLLLLARSDEGQLVAGTDPVDLDELVLAEGDRLRAGRRTVDLHRVGGVRVRGDREQLRRVVRNLADNAERHATTTVAFELAERDGWAELVVADDGPGIPPADRSRVFERFARLDEARDRPGGGTGLGLAIVGEVVAAHGGTVAVGDSPIGARMVVRLPAEGPAALVS